MDSAEPPSSRQDRSRFPPADARRRALARLVDLLLPLPLVVLADPFGHSKAFALAAALVFCGDALFGPGRSPGKRLFSLRVVQVPSGKPLTVTRALARNALFALALVPGIVDARLAAITALLLSLALEAAVALRPLARELGQRRLGDLLAGTQVIDSRIGLPLETPIPLRRTQAAVEPSSVSRQPEPKKDAACA